MKTANDRGFNIRINIGLLGTFIYEIITGEKVRVELFDDDRAANRPYWPKRQTLPEATGIWHGWIIEGCRDGQFQMAHCVLRASGNAHLTPLRQSSDIRFGQTIKDSIKAQVSLERAQRIFITCFLLLFLLFCTFLFFLFKVTVF